MEVMSLSRRLAWTGRHCIARTATVGIMENLSKSDGWFATAVAGANLKPAVRRVEAAWRGATGRRTTGLGTDPLIFETAVRALAGGNSLRATARIVEVDKELVRNWLDRAARQCRAVMLYLWRELPATECQLDELWSFVHTKQENLPGAQHYLDSYGETWVWLAFAPVWRLVLGFVVGNRDQTSANRLLGKSLRLLTLISCRCLPAINGLPTPRRC